MDSKKKINEYLKKIDSVIANGRYKDTWDSLCGYPVAKWYQNAKFGIFIHWGVYSVPAYANEWYPREMYVKDSNVYRHHVEKYGEHKNFGYKDFIPMFKAEKFDADEWMELFASAGARYVMPVAEHHDGFKMYKSDLNKWNAYNMGPRRDVVGELKTAAEKRNIKLCCSNHRAEHYFFFNGGLDYESDVSSGEYDDFYGPPAKPEEKGAYNAVPTAEHCEDWLATNCEMVDLYQPKVVWFDWWIQNIFWKPYLRKFAAYYYNRALEWSEASSAEIEVAINYKYDAYMYTSAIYDIERGQLSNILPRLWQNDTSTAKNSWCYTENNDFKKASDLTADFVDIISKNGCLLLNVGPKPDGTITDEDKEILTQIGGFMKKNAEAIYDTSVWKVYGEGTTEVPEGAFSDTNRNAYSKEDVRFTCKGSNLYMFILNSTGLSELKVNILGKKYHKLDTVVKSASILGYDGVKVEVSHLDESCGFILSEKISSEHPVCIKLELE